MPKPMMKRKRRITPAQKQINRNFIVDYKDPRTLQRFLQENGAIHGRDMTGLTQKQQRALTTHVKRARHLAMLPFTQTL
jgi:small subunit ribosomal protein S18